MTIIADTEILSWLAVDETSLIQTRNRAAICNKNVTQLSPHHPFISEARSPTEHMWKQIKNETIEQGRMFYGCEA